MRAGFYRLSSYGRRKRGRGERGRRGKGGGGIRASRESGVRFQTPITGLNRVRAIDWNRFGDDRTKDNGLSRLDHVIEGTYGKLLGQGERR